MALFLEVAWQFSPSPHKDSFFLHLLFHSKTQPRFEDQTENGEIWNIDKKDILPLLLVCYQIGRYGKKNIF